MGVSETEKVVGILGGMGPEATVDLMQRVIHLTPAADDGDHLRMIVDNNPKVPSRIKALIEKTGENPGPCMADMGRRLENWGADFLVIPCNTAHYYYDYVKEAVAIPVVHLVDLTASVVARDIPGIQKAGILASTAVLNTGLYETAFARHGVDVMYPAPMEQQQLLGVIKAVKAGDTGEKVRSAFREIATSLSASGAEVVVLACTELGVIGKNLPCPAVDAAGVLADEIVAVARNQKTAFEKVVDKGASSDC